MTAKEKDKVTVSFLQKVQLNNLIPEEAGLTATILNVSLRKKLSITPKDIVDFDIKDSVTSDGKPSIAYNTSKTANSKFALDLNDSERKQLRNILQMVIAKKKLNHVLLDVAIQLKCSDPTQEDGKKD